MCEHTSRLGEVRLNEVLEGVSFDQMSIGPTTRTAIG